MQVEDVWADLAINPERPIFRRVDEEHPLDLYLGLDQAEDRVLMLVNEAEPPEVPSFEAIAISKSARGDGRWVLAVRLVRRELSEPFAMLCRDIIESTRNVSAASGSGALLKRLYRWKRLLQPDRKGLSESEARGLFGELMVLRETLIPKFGELASVLAWTGPEDAPQDFRLPGVAIEVKTRATGAHTVVVSSLDQLDGAGSELFLVAIALDASVKDDGKAMSLVELVEKVREKLAVQNDACAQFNLALTQMGFVESDPQALRFYRPGKQLVFRVREGFPCLTRATVCAGILDAKYVLDLSQCDEFESEID
jgi:hypothetical protein